MPGNVMVRRFHLVSFGWILAVAFRGILWKYLNMTWNAVLEVWVKWYQIALFFWPRLICWIKLCQESCGSKKEDWPSDSGAMTLSWTLGCSLLAMAAAGNLWVRSGYSTTDCSGTPYVEEKYATDICFSFGRDYVTYTCNSTTAVTNWYTDAACTTPGRDTYGSPVPPCCLLRWCWCVRVGFLEEHL